MRIFRLMWLVAFVAATAAPLQGAWHPAKGPLVTRWASQVRPDNVWPEYPRPQLVRKDWTNLNGLWDYAIVAKDADQPAQWDGRILVPFCVESSLSGVMKAVTPDQALWYHRTFSSPNLAGGKRLLLHFGAVDWDCTVQVNGKTVGHHRGGYDPFTCDITDVLRAGDNELVVRVWDPTDTRYQPHGKQVLHPRGILYTAVTGIWQTVWLEPVSACRVESLRLTPDVDHGTITVALNLQVDGGKVTADVEIRDGGAFVQRGHIAISGAHGPTQTPKLTLSVPGAKLWSPDSPHLYDLKIALSRDGKVVDTLTSYFGMRKIEVKKDEQGINRLFLNNKPLFQFGPLDQGWWPDGLYTAPCDEALKYDIQATKKLGMNLARKHVKVEHARWYYWADKLGLLIWQDMPSGDKNARRGPHDITRSAESGENFERELKAMIRTHINHPSIVMWVAYNESWGQWDTPRICRLIKQLDPTRLVDNASGWADRGVGDVHDIHRYPGPGMAGLEEHRAVVLGEFGGLGLPLAGHTWKAEKNWGYRNFKTREDLTAAYVELLHKLRPLIGKGLCAAVYTQTSDVEVEVNGLMTYDRQIIKPDLDQARRAADQLYQPPPVIKAVVPTSQTRRQRWRYTTKPPPADWAAAAFDDASWASGPGGFGTKSTPGAVVGTEWKSSDIWLRRTFDMPVVPGDVELLIHHDEDAEVYINGVSAAKLTGFTTDYTTSSIRPEARQTLKPKGNVIAVHCRQTTGGQFIDVGLALVLPAEHASARQPRWSAEKAWRWYRGQPWPCGFNYIPANAISYTEMWMPYGFDAARIDKELALAQRTGFNCLRVVLPFVVWEHDPPAFKKRLDTFLDICQRHGLKAMLIFFDDCVFGPITDPRYGRQPDVVAGWYANGWTPSPGHRMVRDPTTWPRLERYVKDIVTTFGHDPRVWVWDLYNEPTNGGMREASLPLAEKVFAWARAAQPDQPLTIGQWSGHARLNDLIRRESDILSFHQYGDADKLQATINRLKQHGRPIICTEWLNRRTGSQVSQCLPVFFKQKVGCLHWGLVNGKTQTHLNWGHRPGQPAPKVWQHDLYHGDYRPYDPKELQLFRHYIALSRHGT